MTPFVSSKLSRTPESVSNSLPVQRSFGVAQAEQRWQRGVS